MSKAGRPPKYKSKKDMQRKIDEYFAACEGTIMTDDNGEMLRNKYGYPVILNKKPPTVTGLALALGFASRQALLNYQIKDEFNDAITRAKSRVEQYAEERLFDKEGSSGAQFSLRNNFKGWDFDKKDSEQDGDKVVIINNIPRPEENE